MADKTSSPNTFASAADVTTTSGRADFVDNQRASINQDEQHAQIIIRDAFDMVVSHDVNKVGEVLLNKPLDTTFNVDTQQLAERYEYYRFKNLQMTIHAVSPFGTSSGGIQVCHITDPENATFYTEDKDLPENVTKAVRQQSSMVIRPRDTKTITFELDEMEMFTKQSTSLRFSSFGNVAIVVRQPPAAGDEVVYVVTISGVAVFTRTTAVDPNLVTLSPRIEGFTITYADDKIFLVAHQMLRPRQYISFKDEPFKFSKLKGKNLLFINGKCELRPKALTIDPATLKFIPNNVYVRCVSYF